MSGARRSRARGARRRRSARPPPGDRPSRWFLLVRRAPGASTRTSEHRSSGSGAPWRKPDFWGDVTPQCRDSTSSATVLRRTPRMRGDRAPPLAAYGVGAGRDARQSQVAEFQRGEPARCSTTISARAPTLVVPTTSVLSGTDRPHRPHRGHGVGSGGGPRRRRLRHRDGRHPGRRRAARSGRRHHGHHEHGHRGGPRPALPAAHRPRAEPGGGAADPAAPSPSVPDAAPRRRPPRPPPRRRPPPSPRRRRARAPSPRSRPPSCARPRSPRTRPTRAPPSPSARRSPRSACPTCGAATGPPTATPGSTARA